MNAKRGIPFFSLSLAVAEGPAMGDVTFGYVYDFGARRGVDGRARPAEPSSNGAPLDAPPPKDDDRDPLLRGDDDRLIADRVAGAPRRRASGCG